MTQPVKPIPDGYHMVTPYLTVPDAEATIAFLQNAFGAEVTFRMNGADGTAQHVELRMRDSMLMLSQARGEWSPLPASFYLYVTDVDAVYRQALTAGAQSIAEPVNQFYGDRSGGVKDSAGNSWWIATHVEDVDMEEMERRAQAAGKV
ncbi:MAG: VOC family protein [Blastocatellia bacterium]|nr:VOC family protein [Blastocatellia bacterium]